MTRKHYIVRWEISTMAETPEEAAQEVFSDFFLQGSDATLFDVEPHDGSTGVVIVDVADLSEEA